MFPLTLTLSPKGRGDCSLLALICVDHSAHREREMEASGNRDFAIQIDVLNRIDQLHAVGHRFLKRLTAKD